MNNFEQLLDKVLNCVTESTVEDVVIRPTIHDTIVESVTEGDISIDECKVLLESVDDSDYLLSVLERFEEGVIDNDECIVLLEATRYEKEHTKALQELKNLNKETQEKIKSLNKLKETASDSIKEKLEHQIEKLTHDLASKIDKYKENYSKSDDPNYGVFRDNQKTRIELGKEYKPEENHMYRNEKSKGKTLKNLERDKNFNTPSTKVREPGLYLKAHQGK